MAETSTTPAEKAFTAELDRLRISFHGEAAVRAATEQDFGHIVRGVSFGAVVPNTAEEALAVVRSAGSSGVRLTPRTHGNSQSGQSVPQGGFALDLSRLSRVEVPERERLTIECGPAASWRSVMSVALEHGLVPKAMPMNLNLSVGGTVSAGGVGGAGHRYGPCAASVVAAQVLTGGGEIKRVSHDQNPELFALLLGGQGRCGVLLSVTLALRRTTGRVETAYLLYDSVDACLAQLPVVAKHPEVAYAEAYCSALFQGLKVTDAGRRPLLRWFGGLQVTREVDASTPASDDWFADFGAREVVHRETDSVAGFSGRYEARFDMMKRSGDWLRAHPWFECFLPPSRAAAVIRQALGLLPAFFGDGHRMFAIRVDERLEYLAMPPAEDGFVIAFAVLPTAIADWALPDALACLTRLQDVVMSAGGKRYLSGWLGDAGTPEFWQAHYGSRYERWVRAKVEHDPHGVFSSALYSPLDAAIRGRGPSE